MSEILAAESSPGALSSDNPLRREPRSPERERPRSFHDAFDARTLFYDCFRRGADVLLVGPPPLNLKPAFDAARFTAHPSRARLRARFYSSLSIMITSLADVPPDTETIEVEVAGEKLLLPIQRSSVDDLAGRRVLFSVNKNNDLAWIREWALFHATLHGTDAVVLFDNGSTRYGGDELAATLADVPGIAKVAVPQWNVSFGPIDPAVRVNPYWARFFQISSMSVTLRRYGESAYGLLNCDIDELAGTRSGISIYDLAKRSRGGLVAFRGTWIEASREGSRHRDYTRRLADRSAAESRQRKWALDPTRPWVRGLNVHPYWHWIHGRPIFSKTMPDDATYWHFKPISTNWKVKRTDAPAGKTVEDAELAATFARLPV
jgi:hypothetical protein